MATALRLDAPARVTSPVVPVVPTIDGPQPTRAMYITAVAGNALTIPLRSGNDTRFVEAMLAQFEATGSCAGDVFTFRVQHDQDCAAHTDDPCDCDPHVSVLRQVFGADRVRRGWLGALIGTRRG